MTCLITRTGVDPMKPPVARACPTAADPNPVYGRGTETVAQPSKPVVMVKTARVHSVTNTCTPVQIPRSSDSAGDTLHTGDEQSGHSASVLSS